MTLSNLERKEIREQLNDRERLIMNELSNDRRMHRLKFDRMDEKIDRVLIALEVNEANREADTLQVKNDLKPIKINWFIVIDKNKALKVIYWSVFIFTFWQQLSLVIDNFAEKQGIEINSTQNNQKLTKSDL